MPVLSVYSSFYEYYFFAAKALHTDLEFFVSGWYSIHAQKNKSHFIDINRLIISIALFLAFSLIWLKVKISLTKLLSLRITMQ